MSLFNFRIEELMCFFAVLVRYSVLFSVLPFIGDHQIPAPVKVLLSLSVTFVLYPGLVANGHVRPADALVWGASAGGILGTIALEVVFGLLLGYTARMSFEVIEFAGNLVGNYMGYGIASTYDPGQQSQTQVVAQIQMTVAMLIFLALDGHHLMLRAALQSFQIVGIGGMGRLVDVTTGGMNYEVATKLVELSSQVIKFGIQLSAPIAVVLFGTNVAFGVMARAMPQLNLLVLSVGISSLIGLALMFICLPEFQGAAGNVLSRIGDNMLVVMQAVAGKGK